MESGTIDKEIEKLDVHKGKTIQQMKLTK